MHINIYICIYIYIYIYDMFCDYESLLAPQLIHQAEHFAAYGQYALLHLGAPSPLHQGVMPAKVCQFVVAVYIKYVYCSHRSMYHPLNVEVYCMFR